MDSNTALTRFLEMIDEQAEKSVADWKALPKVDPLKTLAGFVAVIASSLDKEVSVLDQTIAEKLPGVFGVKPQAATAASGFLRLIPSKAIKNAMILDKGFKVRAKTKNGVSLSYSTTEDTCLFDFGDVIVEHEANQVWIGLENAPKGHAFGLYFDFAKEQQSVKVKWQVLAKAGLTHIDVLDQTDSFSRSGVVNFIETKNLNYKCQRSGKSMYWLVASCDVSLEAPLRGIYTNVAPLSNITTYSQHYLGSGVGAPSQRMKLPEGQLISCLSLKVYDADKNKEEIWIETSSFLSSTAADKHFIYDPVTNELVFGDGIRGACLTPGYDNVWVSQLTMTGGAAGNVTRETPVELVDADWRIASAELIGDLLGGTNFSDSDDLLKKMHATYHHKERAISLDDFESLTPQSSPRIGMAFARSLRPGHVEIFPLLRPEFSAKAESLDFSPDGNDLKQVHNYLDRRRALNVKIDVRPPVYRDITLAGDIQLHTAKEINLKQIRSLISCYFSPYKKSDSRLLPGSKIEKEAVMSFINNLPFVANIVQLNLVDERTGLRVEQIDLAINELPRLKIKLRFDEVGL